MTDDQTTAETGPTEPQDGPPEPAEDADALQTIEPPGEPPQPAEDAEETGLGDESKLRKARSEARNLRGRLHDTETTRDEQAAELAQLRTQLAQHAAEEQARQVDLARAQAAADQRIPAGLTAYITGATPEEIRASAIGLANELRWLTEIPLIGVDPAPIRARTLEEHHQANLVAARQYDAQPRGGTVIDRMTAQVRGI